MIETLKILERILRLVIPAILIIELLRMLYLMETNNVIIERLTKVLELLPCID